MLKVTNRVLEKSRRILIACLWGASLLSLWPASSGAVQLPSLPQAFIDTTYSPPAGNTLVVNAGGDLQAAINNAVPGDTIVLQAGATFVGPFSLPNKTAGSGWIYIRSSAYGSLPAPGTRVSPADVANMPTITVGASGGSAIETKPRAHHFRFVGIQFKPVANNFIYNLIRIGTGETALADLPHDITFDRCYIHGDPSAGGRRGVAMNGIGVAVIDSHVSDFKEDGADTQALWAFNTPGPLKMVNNYLEASGENVMIGGADPSIANVVPSDIEIRRNHFFKPLAWMNEPWDVKNLLEFKSGQRILVEGNVLENNWLDAQQGLSILITPRNQDGGAPWTVTQDITIRLNRIVNVGGGFNLSGHDNEHPSQVTRRVLIENNVIGVATLQGADGRIFQFLNGPIDTTIRHNTGFTTSSADEVTAFSDNRPTPADGLVFMDNIMSNGAYGFIGTDKGTCITTLSAYFTNYTFQKNALIGADSDDNPANNFFPANIAAVGFTNYAAKDYRLSASSPFKYAATDGRDLGADIDSLNSATANVVSGNVAIDMTAPTAAVTSPTGGLSVSGVVQLVATASDNVGVAGVTFSLDDSPLGPEISSFPYVLPWNTAGVANGAHMITATATDVAGNRTTSTPVLLLVANPLQASQSPYGGPPHPVPGRIEAENFDNGGEGVSYHDLTPGNQGGTYRSDVDVDITSPRLDVYAVNNFQAGEWLEYTVNVAVGGDFLLEERVSSEYTTSRLRVEIDGADVTGSIGVPTTGSWKSFQWVGTRTVNLTAGRHVVRIVAEQEYFNIDAIRFRRP